jgi:hypothetical protein
VGASERLLSVMAWGPFLQAHYEVLASREKTPAGYPVVFFLVALLRAGAFFWTSRTRQRRVATNRHDDR